MQLARYTIEVPTYDRQGNKLKDLASAAHESLLRNAPGSRRIQRAKVNRNVEVIGGHTFDDLVVYAEETPEMDSIMKQTGVHLSEIANHETITVFKEGKGAPQTWTLGHPQADPSQPAYPIAIAERPGQAAPGLSS